MELNKNQIETEVKRLDQNLKKSEEGFKVACILLTSLSTGANSEKIAKFLDINVRDIRKYEKKLRENKVWVKDKVACDWMNKENGGISFWMDVNVALGFVKRT